MTSNTLSRVVISLSANLNANVRFEKQTQTSVNSGDLFLLCSVNLGHKLLLPANLGAQFNKGLRYAIR